MTMSFASQKNAQGFVVVAQGATSYFLALVACLVVKDEPDYPCKGPVRSIVVGAALVVITTVVSGVNPRKVYK